MEMSERTNHFIRNRIDENKIYNGFHIIGQIMVSILIVYYSWYNEKYNHNAVIVYGSFAILAACVLLDAFINRGIDYRQVHVGIWINFYMGLYGIMIGLLVANDKNALLESAKLVLQLSFIAFSAYYLAIASGSKINWILITLNLSALLCCFFLFQSPYSEITGRYSMSRRNNPNTLGVVLLMGVFSVVYRIKPDLKHIIAGLLQIGVLLYGIIMTGSRKSLIAAMIIVVFSLWNIMKDARSKLLPYQFWGLTIIGIAAIAVGSKYLLDYYFNSRIAQRMQMMVESQKEDSNRILFYQKAWEIFLLKPFFGGGLDQFKFWNGIGVGYAHSTYAEAIADFGLFGCILYFYPILYSGKQLIQKAFFVGKEYRTKVTFTLWLAEMFLGLGQVFFLDVIHYFAWAIIFFEANNTTKPISAGNHCKYIRYD